MSDLHGNHRPECGNRLSDQTAGQHAGLQGVADTTYIPMVARMYASERFPEFFYDGTAVGLRDKIPSGILERIGESSSEYTMIASVARYHVLDGVVRTFVSEHPEGCCVVNLGAGLETMPHRLDMPEVTFYEVDLPETIELRRALIDPLPNEVLVGGDMFEFGWADQVDRTVPSLMVASGVFQYFDEADIVRFLKELGRRFPGSELIFDATNAVGVRYADRYVRKTGNTSARIRFCVDDAQAFAGRLGMPLVGERVFYTEAREVLGRRLKLYTRIAMRVCDDKKRAILVHLKLG